MTASGARKPDYSILGKHILDVFNAELDAFQARGGGVVILHSTTIEDRTPAKLAERIGLAAQPRTVQYRHMLFTLKIADLEHPTTANLRREIWFLDEPYWPMVGDLNQVHLLITALDIDGEDRPMMWTFEKHRSRALHMDARRPALPRHHPARHRVGGPEKPGRPAPRASHKISRPTAWPSGAVLLRSPANRMR